MTAEPTGAVILVIDDLPANRRLMQAILTPHGYEVVEAESGEQGLERLAEGRTDLVLVDLLMPGLDGHETCRRIRANPDTAYLPVVMVTASGPAEKIRAIDAGADDFINKPLDQGELLGRVRSDCLSNSRRNESRNQFLSSTPASCALDPLRRPTQRTRRHP